MKKTIIWLVVLVCVGLLAWKFYPQTVAKLDNNPKVTTPIDISYTIDGKEVKLVNGKATEAIPDSSSSIITSVFGQPSLGDLDGDGVNDSVVLITQQTGGSGVFYYAGVALQKDGAYKSIGTVLLGDRIAPQSILVKTDVAMVNYADRKKGEPMTTSPSVGVTKYLVVEDGQIKQFSLTGVGEQLFFGNLIMSEGSRIFTPCGGTAHWVMGNSKAYSSLMSEYSKNKPAGDPYGSVYAVISGTIVSAPTDGFGMDYSYGIDVNNLLKVLPGGSCSKN